MLINDLRFAVRQLHKNPGFALAVTVTLALGVGVNTAVFSLVNGFLLRPLPYPNPDRLGVLILHQEGVSPKSGQFEHEEDDSQDGQTWEMIRDGVPAVQAAAFGGTSGVNLQAASAPGTDVRYVQDMRVSAHYFDVLGIQPLLGRGFTEEEDRPNGSEAVILSHALWQSVFRADPQVLGKEVRLKGEPYTVVGVLPGQARTTGVADLWTPLQPHQRGECGGDNCEIIIRLAPGASWQQVSAQLAHIRKPSFDGIASRSNGRAWFYASPLERNLDNGMREPVLGLMSAVGFILLIACANLAGLALVRIVRRAQEIATRLALGATRWIVLRQLWVENSVLAFVGAGIGLALARGILASLPGFLPDQMMPLGGAYRLTFRSCLHLRRLVAHQPAVRCATGSADPTCRSSVVDGGRESNDRERLQPTPSTAHSGTSSTHGDPSCWSRIGHPQSSLLGNPASWLRCHECYDCQTLPGRCPLPGRRFVPQSDRPQRECDASHPWRRRRRCRAECSLTNEASTTV